MTKATNIVKKIVLDMDGEEVTLTLEQAQRLHGALTELLGIKPEKEYVTIPQPYPVPDRRPYIPHPWSPPRPWITWSGNTHQTISGLSVQYDSRSHAARLKV